MSLDFNITKQLRDKYYKSDQDFNVHLEGLVYSKPFSYWYYLKKDALLNLLISTPVFPNEMVFKLL